LGQTGRFNGEDVINIIVQQPATARFIAGKLYNFFVSDDPPMRARPLICRRRRTDSSLYPDLALIVFQAQIDRPAAND